MSFSPDPAVFSAPDPTHYHEYIYDHMTTLHQLSQAEDFGQSVLDPFPSSRRHGLGTRLPECTSSETLIFTVCNSCIRDTVPNEPINSTWEDAHYTHTHTSAEHHIYFWHQLSSGSHFLLIAKNRRFLQFLNNNNNNNTNNNNDDDDDDDE